MAEAAAGVIIPKCPAGEAMLSTALCTMGNSLVPILHNPKAVVAAASFSQYPRGYQRPDGVVEAEGGTDSGSPSTSQCILTHCTMGYTMVTTLGGKEYRYTEWVDYGTKEKFTPDWGRNVGGAATSAPSLRPRRGPRRECEPGGEGGVRAAAGEAQQAAAGGAADWRRLGAVGGVSSRAKRGRRGYYHQ